MCILVVLKPMSVPLPRLIPSVSLYPTLCPGPPHQASRFLPSPPQPTTQQVERWSLGHCFGQAAPPGPLHDYPAQVLAPPPTPAGSPAELGWPVRLAPAPAVLCLVSPSSLLVLLLLLCHCWGCMDTCLRTSPPLPLPSRRGGACALPCPSGYGCEPEAPPGRVSAPWGAGC